MTITLSCQGSKGKGAFVVTKGGYVVKSKTLNIKQEPGYTKKNYILQALVDGLKYVKPEHEDLLVIELPNQHLVSWLNNRESYKGYEDSLNQVYLAIQSKPCKYMIRVSKCSSATLQLKKEGNNLEPLHSLEDFMVGLD